MKIRCANWPRCLNVRYRRDEDGDIDHSNLITVLDAGGRIVFQREGLEGDPDEVKAVRELLAKAEETHP
jgi:protein SCO1/2